MVGRLVQQQQVGALQQKAAERHTAALAAGERLHLGVAGRAPQRIHGNLDGAIQLPAVGGVDLLLKLRLLGQESVHLVVAHLLAELAGDLVEAVEQRLHLAQALDHVLHHGLGVVELRLLGEIPHLGALGDPSLAAILLVEAGHDPEHRRLAGAVGSQHADLGAGQK